MDKDSEEEAVEEVTEKDRQAITLRCFNCTDYKRVEGWALISQIRSFAHPLHDVEQQHKDTLYQSFDDHGFDYSKGAVTVTFVSSVCPSKSF